uniref:THD domain-containing protein n=1 Tax=Cyprinodon variegatus TaxID=28743 RepID=A0A3Q2D7K3_CYPVA
MFTFDHHVYIVSLLHLKKCKYLESCTERYFILYTPRVYKMTIKFVSLYGLGGSPLYVSHWSTSADDTFRLVQNILLWETELGNARIQGGFKYSNGNLIVPRDGIYRVYLQITYSSESAEANGQSVCNKVNVISLSYEKRVPLLSACDTIVFSKTPWKKSLFTSGSFRLYAKDKLLVTSSHSNYIFRNEHEGFFGAELVFDNL